MLKNENIKIRALSFLMFAIPLIVASYFFIYENTQQRKESEIEKNITLTRAGASFIEHEIAEKIRLLGSYSQMPAFQNLEKSRLALVVKAMTEPGCDFFITDTGGKVIAHNRGVQSAQIPLGDPYFKKVLAGQKVIANQDKSPVNGNFAVMLYVPIREISTGKIVGVVGNQLEKQFFHKRIDPMRFGRKSFFSLLDAKGDYIYDPGVDNSKKNVPSRCFKDGVGKDLNITERKSIRPPVDTKVFIKVKIPELGWYVVSFQPLSELTIPAMAVLTRNLVAVALLVLTVIILWRYKVTIEKRQKLVERQNAEKLALIGELAAGMAHEIRNPLTTLKGFSDLLKEKEKYKEDREIFDLISESVDHIEGIVRETLLLAKPQKMKETDVDLVELAREATGFMNNQALLEEVELIFEGGNRPQVVRGDRQHLKQLMVNLIKNAIEATPRHGRVLVNVVAVGWDTIKISVKDSGGGMNPALMSKLGTPFLTTKVGGTGLGLSVCRRIVEEHKGEIKIFSEPGQGTVVEVYFKMSTPATKEETPN